MSSNVVNVKTTEYYKAKEFNDFIQSLTNEEIEYLLDRATGTFIPPAIYGAMAAKAHIAGWKHFKSIPVYAPPAPRLVGVETNPGPTLLIADGKQRRKPRKGGKQVALAITRPTRTPRRRNVALSNELSEFSRSQQFAKTFAAMLTDPWDTPPIKLGYDCFTNTVLGTAYVRSFFTVNADGSFALIMSPGAGGSMVLTNAAGAATATWSQVGPVNASAITNQMSEARVVSGGIRAFALFPETSSPGVMLSGLLPSSSITSATAMTPNQLGAVPGAELGIGSRGCRGVLLPQDPDSYTFSPLTSSGYTAGSYFTSSVPFITGYGFPTGTVIWYESVLNLEGLPLANGASIGINPETNDMQTTAARFFPTPERLWSAAKQFLTSPTVMDAAAGLINSGIRGTAVGRILGNARNASRALAAGASSINTARTSTITIEEMKEANNTSWMSLRRQ